MRTKLFFSILFAIQVVCNAQRLNQYIVFENKDTLICTSLEHKATQHGRLKYLKYTANSKTVELKGKMNIPKLDCFSYDQGTFDMLPRRSYRKKHRNIVGKRLINGKLSYCYFSCEKLFVQSSTAVGGGGTQKSGFRLRYAKFKDGSYLRLTRKSMRKKIKPILQSCEAFKQEYKGRYKLDYFGYNIQEMFNLYNRLCP